ncbi:MAG: hypothetical protein AAGC60_06435 [Acidobacteriota bacterium]
MCLSCPSHRDAHSAARSESDSARARFGVSLVAFAALGLVLFASSVAAQTVTTDAVECLPIGENAVGWASIDAMPADAEVRLYFRRMHDTVEDLYWVRMQPAGEGRYWGIFPQAEDHALEVRELEEARAEAQREVAWAQWWREKDASDHRDPNSDLDQDLIRERASQGKQVERDWLGEMDDREFQEWLETLENEPTEYYTAVNDFQGNELARSPTRVAPVSDNCRVDLSEEERGVAENMIVGETAYWQRGEQVFHWLCDGIIARVDPNGVRRGDEICRACVIAWWKRPGILVPAAVGAGVVTGVILVDDDSPAPVSPSEP